MSFDWQTEDDTSWDDPDFISSNSGEKISDGKRPFWRWLIPLGLLVVALTAAGWTLNRRVQTVTAQMEADVLASYDLATQAVAQQDAEILQSVLSGRDQGWSAALTEVVVQGILTDRSGLGLMSLSQAESLTPTIEVRSDLLEADVTTVVPYAIEIGNGLTETVQLVQTAVYRLGSNRWLLSPPDIAYWNGVRQIEGQYVTLFYPERDKTVAQALLLSLDEKIGQLCTQFQDVACPDDYQLIVELATDPAALAQMDLLPMVKGAERRRLVLPTPTLVGLPLDQAGERALFRGYGRLVAAAVLTDLWRYECCDDSVALYFAVLEDRLRQLGLQALPGEVGTANLTSLSAGVSTQDYDALLEDLPLLFSNLNTWGEVRGDSLWLSSERAGVLAAFAQQELDISGRELVQNLSVLGRSNPLLGDWLRTLSRISLSESELENAWRSFVYNHSSAAQQTPPAPLPDQDIQLLCQMGDEERMALYRYDLAANAIMLEQPLNRFVDKMVALPGDNGLAVWEDTGEAASLTQLFLWVDGQKSEISWDASENAPGPIPLHLDPTNSKLILAPADSEHMNYGLLDVSSCMNATCQLETLDGYPIWSPDGVHMILVRASTVPPYRTDAYGRLDLTDDKGEEIRTLDYGSSPFWLDDDTFGFVTDAGEGSRHTIVTGEIGGTGREWDELLTVGALTAVLDDNRPHLIDFAAVHPHYPDRLVIVTSTDEGEEQFVFVYNLTTEQFTLAQPFFVNSGSSQSYRFSPNGRFLLMAQFELGEEPETGVSFVDLANGDTTLKILDTTFDHSIYWLTDFSEKGDWLLISDNKQISVVYPGTDYERLIFPETGPCKTAVWINKNNGV